MARIDEVNAVMMDYKCGRISKDACIQKIATQFQPLYNKFNNRVLHQSFINGVDASGGPDGDFYNTYLDTISYSIDKFDFDIHDPNLGQNKISFVPFFERILYNRFINYTKVLNKETQQIKSIISINQILDAKNKSEKHDEFVQKYLSFDKNLSDKEHLELEEQIKKILTKREYRIFWYRMKGFTFKEIGPKMLKYQSGEKIRQEWDACLDRLWTLLNQRIRDEHHRQ